MRQCSKCLQAKPDSEFEFRKDIQKYRRRCHTCQSSAQKERWHNRRLGDFDIDVAAPAEEPSGPGPVPENPIPILTPPDLEHLSNDGKTNHIAGLIPEVARAYGVEACDVTWWQFRHYCQIAWGESAEGITRHHITLVGGFNSIRDAFHPPTATTHRQERAELHALAVQNRAAARGEVRDALLCRQIEEVLARAEVPALPPEGFARKFSQGFEGERTITVLWNDDHFDPGSMIPGYDELGQCRRVAAITSQVLEYKRQYRSRTALRYVINGDMIENWLHGQRGAHPSVQAVSAALKYAQSIRQCAAEYTSVEVVVIPGNHDRDIATDPKRALEDKVRGWTTIIGNLIKAYCRDLKNVRVAVQGPEVILDYYGQHALVTHGDTLFGKATPKNVESGAVEYIVGRFNEARAAGELGKVVLVALGHYHVDLNRVLDNGVRVLINPALTPSNEFARSVDAFQSFNGHYIFESVPGYIFGDNRCVAVTMATSRDPRFDGLISPYTEVAA